MTELTTILIGAGLPTLVVLFYLEGLVIGKLLQPPVVFVGYVAATNPGRELALVVGVACVVAATLGQWTLYRGFNDDAPELVGIRRTVPYLESVPDRVLDRVGERRMTLVNRLFDRYGGWSICFTNAVPGIRGLLAIPSGLAAYPRSRFAVAAVVGNCLYFLLLFAAAAGLLGAFQFLFGA